MSERETPLSLAAEVETPLLEWALKWLVFMPASFIISLSHLPMVVDETGAFGF